MSLHDDRIHFVRKLGGADNRGQLGYKGPQEGITGRRNIGVVNLESQEVFRHKDQKTEGVLWVRLHLYAARHEFLECRSHLASTEFLVVCLSSWALLRDEQSSRMKITAREVMRSTKELDNTASLLPSDIGYLIFCEA